MTLRLATVIVRTLRWFDAVQEGEEYCGIVGGKEIVKFMRDGDHEHRIYWKGEKNGHSGVGLLMR